jgi:hypothetical protein
LQNHVYAIFLADGIVNGFLNLWCVAFGVVLVGQCQRPATARL